MGNNGFPLPYRKSCGKRHAYCNVCRPDLIGVNKGTRPGKKLGANDTNEYAPGYTPSLDGSTMWERHVRKNGLDQDALQPRFPVPVEPRIRIVGLDKPRKPDSRLKPLDQVMKDVALGKRIGNRELREYFGFTTKMISNFRYEVRREKKDGDPEKRWVLKEKAAERERLIIEDRMKDPPLTLEQIGANHGVTRERIRQILKRAEVKYGVTFPRYSLWQGGTARFPGETRPEEIKVAVPCRVCKKIREVVDSEKDRPLRSFCDEHVMSPYGIKAWEKTGVEWWAMTPMQKNKWKYHNDARYRSTRQIAMNAYTKRVRQDPVKYKKMRDAQREYSKEWHKKRNEVKNYFKPRPFIEVPDHDDDTFIQEEMKRLLDKKNGN